MWAFLKPILIGLVPSVAKSVWGKLADKWGKKKTESDDEDDPT